MAAKNYLPLDFECSEEVRTHVNRKIATFSLLSDELPVFVIHDRKSNSVVYMSETGLTTLGVTLDELKAMGDQYYNLFFDPKDVVHYLKHWEEFEADPNNKGSWFTFFQQVTDINLDKPQWFLSVSKVLLYDQVSGAPLFALTLALKLNQYLPIAPKLERLVNENNFLREHMKLFTQLTKREKEILTYMSQGLSLKEISAAQFSSEETLRTHRKNIKRKLKVKNDIDLLRFAQAFNIV